MSKKRINPIWPPVDLVMIAQSLRLHFLISYFLLISSDNTS